MNVKRTLNEYRLIDEKTTELLCGMAHVLIDREDFDRVRPYQWTINGNGYVTSGAGAQQIIMHRLILDAKADELVDHINCDKLDNRKRNLRLCARQGNAFNYGPRCDNRSGYRGVRFHQAGRWTAQICFRGRAYHIGCFDTAEEAANAYDSAASVFAGEFAWRNLPDVPLNQNIVLKAESMLGGTMCGFHHVQ